MRGDRAPNRRNRVGAWRKPGGQPPAKRRVAGRPATDRIVAVTINVDSLRGKVGCVLRAIDDLARRVEARVAVLVLEETKLEPGVEIQIPDGRERPTSASSYRGAAAPTRTSCVRRRSRGMWSIRWS